MLEPLGKDSQSKRLCPRDGLIAALTIGKDAWKVWNFSDPAPILFLIELDCELHRTCSHGLNLIQKAVSA